MVAHPKQVKWNKMDKRIFLLSNARNGLNFFFFCNISRSYILLKTFEAAAEEGGGRRKKRGGKRNEKNRKQILGADSVLSFGHCIGLCPLFRSVSRQAKENRRMNRVYLFLWLRQLVTQHFLYPTFFDSHPIQLLTIFLFLRITNYQKLSLVAIFEIRDLQETKEEEKKVC